MRLLVPLALPLSLLLLLISSDARKSAKSRSPKSASRFHTPTGGKTTVVEAFMALQPRMQAGEALGMPQFLEALEGRTKISAAEHDFLVAISSGIRNDELCI